MRQVHGAAKFEAVLHEEWSSIRSTLRAEVSGMSGELGRIEQGELVDEQEGMQLTYLLTYLLTCLLTYLLTYLLIYVFTYLRTYVLTYLRTY